jgi:hypothetical protein
VLLNFFIIHFFYTLVWLLLSSCRYFKCSLILIITSYLPSYIVISKFFFFVIIITLAAVCCTQHLWCCEVVMVSCVDSLPVCRHETSYQKNPHRLFMIPARTSLRSHAPAFMSPTCGISHSCEYAAHVSKNVSHIATLALDVPFLLRCWFFFFHLWRCRQVLLTRSRHKRSLWPFRSAGSRRPCRAPFLSIF